MPTALLLAAAEPITRDGARRAALRELSKGEYQQQRPSLTQQILQFLADRLGSLLDRASHAMPGGGWGLIVLLLVFVAAVVAIWRKVGPLAKTAALDRSLDVSGPLSAAEHRRRADQHAEAGRDAEAVRESMRAVARGLEERAVLDPREGRTADEVAREGGTGLPAATGALRLAAGSFDDIWYGGRAATPADSAAVRDAEQVVHNARPAALTGASGSAWSTGSGTTAPSARSAG